MTPETPFKFNLSDDGLRDLFAALAPEPTTEEISTEYNNRNPYNDHKSPIRGRLEIIAALRYNYGEAMVKESKRRRNATS